MVAVQLVVSRVLHVQIISMWLSSTPVLGHGCPRTGVAPRTHLGFSLLDFSLGFIRTTFVLLSFEGVISRMFPLAGPLSISSASCSLHVNVSQPASSPTTHAISVFRGASGCSTISSVILAPNSGPYVGCAHARPRILLHPLANIGVPKILTLLPLFSAASCSRSRHFFLQSLIASSRIPCGATIFTPFFRQWFASPLLQSPLFPPSVSSASRNELVRHHLLFLRRRCRHRLSARSGFCPSAPWTVKFRPPLRLLAPR